MLSARSVLSELVLFATAVVAFVIPCMQRPEDLARALDRAPDSAASVESMASKDSLWQADSIASSCVGHDASVMRGSVGCSECMSAEHLGATHLKLGIRCSMRSTARCCTYLHQRGNGSLNLISANAIQSHCDSSVNPVCDCSLLHGYSEMTGSTSLTAVVLLTLEMWLLLSSPVSK